MQCARAKSDVNGPTTGAETWSCDLRGLRTRFTRSHHNLQSTAVTKTLLSHTGRVYLQVVTGTLSSNRS